MSKKNNYLSVGEKEIILQMHKEGYTTVAIGKCLNRNNTTIGRFLKRNGEVVHNLHNGILFSDIEQITAMYKNGIPATKIYEQYKEKIKCPETVINIVARQGIEIRCRGVQTYYNHNYFEKIDTEHKAYYLGLFLADGNVCKLKRNTPQYVVQISLKSSDKYIIDEFRSEIHADTKISTSDQYTMDGKMHSMSHFSISSNKMAQDLSKYGVVERKTGHEYLTNLVPQELFRHYVRGIFDGDGTVFFTNPPNRKGRVLRFGFYGSHILITQLSNYLTEVVGISQKRAYDKPSVSFNSYSTIDDIVKFYNFIYTNTTVYLTRKKEKFDAYFDEKRINPNADTEVTL